MALGIVIAELATTMPTHDQRVMEERRAVTRDNLSRVQQLQQQGLLLQSEEAKLRATLAALPSHEEALKRKEEETMRLL